MIVEHGKHKMEIQQRNRGRGKPKMSENVKKYKGHEKKEVRTV